MAQHHSKGGKARARKLSPGRRTEIARQGARTRWGEPKPPKERPLRISPEEQYVIFAALCVMIDDVHAVQDQMTEEQWALAESFYRRLTKLVDARDRATPV